VRPIRFEAADSPEYTAIGEGLTRPARAAGRLETGRSVGKYALRHDDGCAVCDRPVQAGEPFYLDPDAGEVLCVDHGRERRVAAERADSSAGSDGGEGAGDGDGDGTGVDDAAGAAREE
jgi:hypothetical protein